MDPPLQPTGYPFPLLPGAGLFVKGEQMILKPGDGRGGCQLQGARLFEKMGGAGNNLQALFGRQLRKRQAVQVQDHLIQCPDDEQGGRGDLVQTIHGQIGPAPPGDYRLYPAAQAGRGLQGRSRPSAGPKKPKANPLVSCCCASHSVALTSLAEISSILKRFS